eukprot:887415-Rhodomonas_salina.1
MATQQEEEQRAKAVADTDAEDAFDGIDEEGEENASESQAPSMGTAQMKSQANPNLIRMAFT